MKKQQITYKTITIRLSVYFSAERLQARREWQDKGTKGKNIQQRLLYSGRISFRFHGETKSFIDKQRLGFRKGKGTRDQIANIHWIINKAREFQKNIYYFFTDYAKACHCVDHNKLWKILKEMGIPDHLTCLLRNL